MKRKSFYAGVAFFVLFAAWTAALSFVDVRPIGPQGSSVGFATINNAIHEITGVHLLLYTITDWLGIVPICFMVGFAIFGLAQLIKRKSLFRVDSDIIVLGGFYIAVMATYIFFEIFVVNYRPILINGVLEASYPSSTTLLTMCVMLATMIQFNTRIKKCKFKITINAVISSFIAFMVICRLVSGVHWFSDIVGGILLSLGFVLVYRSFVYSSFKRF